MIRLNRTMDGELLVPQDLLSHNPSRQPRGLALDCVGRVDNLAHLGGKAEEGNDGFPVAPPALRDRRIFAAPDTLIKGLEFRRGSLCVGRPIDRAQLAGDSSARQRGRFVGGAAR
jgi:hypothetical protein